MSFFAVKSRPGLIILIGIAAAIFGILLVLLVPLPSLERELSGYLPSGAREQSRVRGQAMIAVTLTTTQSVSAVLEFYRRKLDLNTTLSPRGGMMTMTRGGLFGRLRSDAFMALTRGPGEAVILAHRNKTETAVLTVCSGKDEGVTYVTVLLERRPKEGATPPIAATPVLIPPGGVSGSSGSSSGLHVAEFSSPAPFDEIVSHYAKTFEWKAGDQALGILPSRLGEFDWALPQKRERAQSIVLTRAAPDGSQRSCVFCFRDGSSSQTQVATVRLF